MVSMYVCVYVYRNVATRLVIIGYVRNGFGYFLCEDLSVYQHLYECWQASVEKKKNCSFISITIRWELEDIAGGAKLLLVC